MHDMQNLMVGMFWGGVVMSLPPVALSIGIVVWLVRQQRAERTARKSEQSAEQPSA